MIEPFEIALQPGSAATAVRVERPEQLPEATRALGLRRAPASLVLIGGADGMTEDDHERLRPLFDGVFADLAARLGAVVLDGGTDTGVMRLMGRARAASAHDFPLVGVLPAAVATLPGEPARDGAAELEPNHTHFVLVPGNEFGEESPWLSRLGDVVGDRSATILVNGGDISLRDAEVCVAAGRPLVVVDGSGRLADAIAAAAAGRPPDDASARIAVTGLVRRVSLDDRRELAEAIDDVLGERG